MRWQSTEMGDAVEALKSVQDLLDPLIGGGDRLVQRQRAAPASVKSREDHGFENVGLSLPSLFTL